MSTDVEALRFAFGLTSNDALRDEVARWRQEAAEQAEIAHNMAKILAHVLLMDEDVYLSVHHPEWREIVKEARAALAGEEVEEPEMDGAEAAERENARCLQAMEESADY